MNAIGLKITNFHYPDQVFAPPGEFVEFPKWVHMPGYPSVIVENEAEEAALRARPGSGGVVIVIPVASPPASETPTDDRVALLQLAKERGIKADGRWKTDRIKAALEAVG